MIDRGTVNALAEAHLIVVDTSAGVPQLTGEGRTALAGRGAEHAPIGSGVSSDQ